MSDHISSVNKSYFLCICDLCRIRNTLDFSTAQKHGHGLISKLKGISNVMNKIRMIQSEEKSHFKLSQIEERSRKASRYETISDETKTLN